MGRTAMPHEHPASCREIQLLHVTPPKSVRLVLRSMRTIAFERVRLLRIVHRSRAVQLVLRHSLNTLELPDATMGRFPQLAHP